jgi:hypothetical protein
MLFESMALPTQNMNRNYEHITGSIEKKSDDNLCRQILESEPAIRVAAFIEGAEVTGYAETARTKNVMSQNSDLRKKIGFWVRMVTEMSRQTDPMFGSTESVTVTHKGLRMVTVPLTEYRSLGLSIDRSADADHIIQKITAKFQLGSTN